MILGEKKISLINQTMKIRCIKVVSLAENPDLYRNSEKNSSSEWPFLVNFRAKVNYRSIFEAKYSQKFYPIKFIHENGL